MHRSRTRKTCAAFTLIELLVVIAIIAVLAGIALPVFNSVQERARATQDLNNLRQLGIGTQTYLNDHDAVYFLPTTDWMTTLHPKYVSIWKAFLSPFDRRSETENDATAPISYGFNTNAVGQSGGGLSTDQIMRPSEFIVFGPMAKFDQKADSTACTISPGATQNAGRYEHNTHINACFADSHVENMLWSVFNSDSPPAGSTDKTSARWHPDPTSGPQ